MFVLYGCGHEIKEHINYEEIILEHPQDISDYLEWPQDTSAANYLSKKLFGNDSIQFSFSSYIDTNHNGFIGPRINLISVDQLIQFDIETIGADFVWNVHANKLYPGRIYQSCYKGDFMLKQSLFFIDSISWVHKYVIQNIDKENQSFTPKWRINLPNYFEMDTVVKKQSRFTNEYFDFWIHLSGSERLMPSEDLRSYSKIELSVTLMPKEETDFYAYVIFKPTPKEERMQRRISPWMIFPEEESQKNAEHWVEKRNLAGE